MPENRLLAGDASALGFTGLFPLFAYTSHACVLPSLLVLRYGRNYSLICFFFFYIHNKCLVFVYSLSYQKVLFIFSKTNTI